MTEDGASLMIGAGFRIRDLLARATTLEAFIAEAFPAVEEVARQRADALDTTASWDNRLPRNKEASSYWCELRDRLAAHLSTKRQPEEEPHHVHHAHSTYSGHERRRTIPRMVFQDGTVWRPCPDGGTAEAMLPDRRKSSQDTTPRTDA